MSLEKFLVKEVPILLGNYKPIKWSAGNAIAFSFLTLLVEDIIEAEMNKLPWIVPISLATSIIHDLKVIRCIPTGNQGLALSK